MMTLLYKTCAHGLSSFFIPHENMVGGLDPIKLPSSTVYFYFFAFLGKSYTVKQDGLSAVGL